MALDDQDIEEFIARLQEDPQLRDRVRNVILADDFLALPGIVARLGERIDRMAAHVDARLDRVNVRLEQVDTRFDGVDARLDRVDVRLQEVDQRLEQVDARLEQVDQRLDGLDISFRNLDGRLGNLEGWRYESTYIQNLGAHLGARFRRPRRVSISEIDALVEAMDRQVITIEQWDQLRRIDFVAIGQDLSANRAEVYIAGELSLVVDANDVRRAHERAEILKLAGLDAVAMVDGESILPDAAKLADELGVRHWVEPRAVA